MQLGFRRAMMPVAFAALLLALNAVGFANSASNTPIAGVHGSGNSHLQSNWNGPSTLLYAQNSDFNGAFSSQNDTNGLGLFAQSYDNFTLGSANNISSVEWIGSYFNPPNQGNITAWTLNIYSDNGGIPGSLLYSTNVAGNGGETFLGFDNVGDPTFLYTLAVNFNAAAGTQYWLSVYPDLGFPPQWGWETGTGGDGAAYQCFQGSCGPLGNDLSFALFGGTSSVPEPGTLVMLGSGVLGLAGVIRRKLV